MVIEGHLDTIFSLSVNFSRHMWRGEKHTTASLGFLVTYITFTFFSNTCGLLGFILKIIFRKIVKGTRDPGIEYFNLIEQKNKNYKKNKTSLVGKHVKSQVSLYHPWALQVAHLECRLSFHPLKHT